MKSRTANHFAAANGANDSGASLPTVARHRSFLEPVRRPEPAGLADMVRAIEADYQFQFARRILGSLVQSATVTIEVAPRPRAHADSPRALALAANLASVWRESLPSALQAIGHGRAAFEKTYRWDAQLGVAVVAGLDYLPFEHSRLVLDASGSFDGIDLVAGGRVTRLESARCWWFALDPTALEPHGRSRYLGAALAVYRDRERLAEEERVWYAKFAIGHGVARAPEREDVDPAANASADPLGLDEDQDPMEVLRRRCLEMASGGILVLSSKTYPDGKFLYDYTESPGQRDGTPLENRRRQLDTAALRSLGIPERAVTQDASTGSYALAEVHREVLGKTCEQILAQLVASFQKYVVDKAVEVNWPVGSRPTLVVRYEPADDDRRRLVMDLVKEIAAQPSLSPLVAEQWIDLPKLLDMARVPSGTGRMAAPSNESRTEAGP